MTDGISATLPHSAPILKIYSWHSADRHGAAGGPDDMGGAAARRRRTAVNLRREEVALTIPQRGMPAPRPRSAQERAPSPGRHLAGETACLRACEYE